MYSKRLVYVLVSYALLLIYICANGEELSSSDRSAIEKNIKIIFFDFFNKKVKMKINGREVLNRVLSVQYESNGIALVKEFPVKRSNVFELEFNDVVIKRIIEIDSSTRLIYINPINEPYISLSNTGVIVLD